MIAWLWDNLIGHFCRHKWETIDGCNLVSGRGGIPYGQKYILRCEKCGNIKTVRAV